MPVVTGTLIELIVSLCKAEENYIFDPFRMVSFEFHERRSKPVMLLVLLILMKTDVSCQFLAVRMINKLHQILCINVYDHNDLSEYSKLLCINMALEQISIHFILFDTIIYYH